LRALESRLAELGGAETAVDAASKQAGGALDESTLGPAVIELDPTLKGRMGRLSVQFPDGATTKARIDVFRAGVEKAATIDYSKLDAELMPGTYDVLVSNRRVNGVEVRSRHTSRLRVGVLRMHLEKSTRFDLFVPGAEQAFYTDYGSSDIGLTPGEIEIEVAGQREKVEVRAGEITEF
jgi:hypothetical protein